MAIANLYDRPAEESDWAAWGFSNQAHHRDIVRAVMEQKNVRLDDWALDPVDLKDFDAWLYRHAEAHRAMDAALGIAGWDLTGLDWRDPEALGDWIKKHGQEHRAAARMLGVG
jgi:hypothetical protein